MRVAICSTGEMRGDPKCLELLRKHIIEPFRDNGATVIDLFVHTRKDPWWLPAKDLPFRGLWVSENRKLNSSVILSPFNPPEAGESEDAQGRRKFLYQSYLQQYQSMRAVANMFRLAEVQDEVPYDWVVRFRPDTYLEKPLPVQELVPEKVNVPWNDWWPYEVKGKRWETITDKLAIGSSHAIWTYLNKVQDLKEFCQSYRLQGEAFTAWQLEKYGIAWHRHEGMTIHQSDKLYNCSLRPDEPNPKKS